MKHFGTIQTFNPDTGFGFIIITEALKRELGIDPRRNLFVHARSLRPLELKGTIVPGMTVSFTIGETGNRPEAQCVTLVQAVPRASRWKRQPESWSARWKDAN